MFRLDEGALIKSINVSELGMLFIKPPDIDFQKEQNISLVMENGSEKRKISGRITRIHNGSFAVAIPSEDGKFLIQEIVSK
ncbi:hypothetical protein [Leptospira kobayashii]|uniref:hypothetical protein n=1 Tax=Leptospira kobayashii TaxID=1917830 RepID=UPI001FA7851E|nr:hypothetical protein [Leptospira kobayashii]